MIDNYLNMLGKIGTSPDSLAVFACIGSSFLLAAANIYSHLSAEKESREDVKKLEQNVLGGHRLN